MTPASATLTNSSAGAAVNATKATECTTSNQPLGKIYSKHQGRPQRIVFIQESVAQEPLGVQWISRAAKNAGHLPKFVVTPDANWIKRVKEYEPDVVGFMCTTGVHKHVMEMCKALKNQYNFLSVFGGHHPTFVPEMQHESYVDVLVKGEGEQAFQDLLNNLRDGRPLSNIYNLNVKEDGHIFHNDIRPLFANLDINGYPDRESLYEASPFYRDMERKNFQASRGCPYKCSFCFHHAWKDKVYTASMTDYLRTRTPEHMVSEIEWVRDTFGVKEVHFVDDIFNLRTQWVEEFCELYAQRVKLPYSVILQSNLLTEKVAKLLKTSGCVSARVAFEAANDRLRNEVLRKGTMRHHLTNSARYIREAGIRLTSLNILAIPGGTFEDDLDTLKLNIEAKVDHPLVSIMQAYPETDINEMTREMGLLDQAAEFNPRFNRNSILKLKHARWSENLHHLFPIVVRFPWLYRFAPALSKIPTALVTRIYLVMYMLFTEWLICELNYEWRKMLGLQKNRVVEFVQRVTAKTWIKVQQATVGKYSKKLALRVQASDFTADAH
ncbi:MAG: B12-binding domain-containing radical SAM protein [Planctomycetes bacterium]|nr:B12-binding domain-containing radical SAM protein [Planctomycetota bacterium]